MNKNRWEPRLILGTLAPEFEFLKNEQPFHRVPHDTHRDTTVPAGKVIEMKIGDGRKGSNERYDVLEQRK